MNSDKLKGRASYPFETIGVAIAFSPRLEPLLCESKILAEVFGAQLLLMHIGERTNTKEAKLDDLIRKIGIDQTKLRVIWHEGDPVHTILELCKLNIVDLLVVGAMQKENMLRYYLGSVARKISRSAKCSVLLLTSPQKSGTQFSKMVVNGIENPKTIHTLDTAVYFGKHLNTNAITVAKEIHQDALTAAMGSDRTAGETSKFKKELSEEEFNKLHSIVVNVSLREGIEISEKQIKGIPGFAIRQYAEHRKADLLVVNSPDMKYGIIDRIFTHDMEYILEDLPTNVLIVHSRVS